MNKMKFYSYKTLETQTTHTHAHAHTHKSIYGFKSDLCGMFRTNHLLARRHASPSIQHKLGLNQVEPLRQAVPRLSKL